MEMNTVENERPTPLVDDIAGTRAKLEEWFSARLNSPVTIPDLEIPEGSGMSNVTLLFDIRWQDDGGSHSESCVGRLQPQIARPVFPDYDLSLQYEVMDAVGRHSDIPVPELMGLELDPSVLGVQFYVMKRTEGRIPSDMPPYNMDGWMMHETTPEQRAGMWNEAVRVMARYHQLDVTTLGFGHLASDTLTPLQQQLAYWENYLQWALEGQRHTICEAALDWLKANQPADEPTVLCWGDARIGNMIFTPDLQGVAAVLDWEMAVLGNPVQDIAWFNYLDKTFAEGLGMPRLEGLPDYESTVALWESSSGHSARDYQYYEIFAGMRYGMILSRIMLATGQESEVQGNFACQLLRKYLDAAG
jgi:aminoglycoside phosphotransferase (APT) family kinase protein